MTYICYNGSFYNDNTPVIHHSNRAFCFGDAIFETIRANGTHLLFFDDHYKRIMKGLSLLNIDLTEDITREKLQKHIEKLLHKNKYYTGTRIRLTIFRNTESKGYEPFNNTPGFLIETKKLSNPEFELNSKGQIIDLFNDIKKPVTPFSTVKCSNAMIYTLAAIYRKENGFDDCLLINEKNALVESVSSNLFIVKNKVLFTPPLDDGCVEGIMRKQIIKISRKLNYKVIDNKSLFPDDLIQADEVFLTNAIRGVSWVVAYKEKRFFNTTSKTLIRELNVSNFIK